MDNYFLNKESTWFCKNGNLWRDGPTFSWEEEQLPAIFLLSNKARLVHGSALPVPHGIVYVLCVCVCVCACVTERENCVLVWLPFWREISVCVNFLYANHRVRLMPWFIYYWVTQKLPQIYTANHATFPIQIHKIAVQICSNFWVPQ